VNQSIPFDDFGGQGPLIHFAHANAYPPGTYRQLITRLAASFRILAVHQRPLWSGVSPKMIKDWHLLANDLIRFFDQQGLEKVIGVGHSLGAVATVMAATQRPDLFRALILIEPVFFSPALLDLLMQAWKNDMDGALPAVKIALHRRNHWSSRQEAFDHFRIKSVFARWTDEALWDYVTAGLVPSKDGGLRLAYPPAMEARVYALSANDPWEMVSRLTQPTLALRGSESDTLYVEAWELWQQTQGSAEFIVIEETGHLLPMEKPFLVAERIERFACRL